METILQIWGGTFYLLAKIFLALSEGKENSKWRISGWIVYLLGIPPWAIILFLNHNWIVMAVEIGTAPAISLGLIVAIKKLKQSPVVLDTAVKVFTILLIVLGIIYSLFDYGGLSSLTQILELVATIGSLLGTYLLAKKNRNGWLYFICMNLSVGTLMLIQEKWIFAVLQMISIGFVIYGYRKSKNDIIK